MKGSELTGSRLLARNSLVNLVGVALPMAAAVFAIPFVIRGMGAERFGILSVAWIVIGYFSLFDFGLGRALTKLVAERLGAEQRDQLHEVVWTALTLMLLLGLVGGALLAMLSPWLVETALRISPELHDEALDSFRVLAIALPIVIITPGLQGILEATQEFGVLAALRVPLGLFNYLGPLLVLQFTNSLVAVVVALAVARVIACAGHLFWSVRVLPELRSEPRRVVWQSAGELARFGGWMTVTNLVSPLMTHLDRFLIGALVSMAAVTFYVTPYEVVTKFVVFPQALMGVFFPAFATALALNRAHAESLFDRAARVVFLAIAPLMLVVITLAPEGMTLWLGADFARNSARILQWLSVGVFFNALAQVPFAFIQGGGRPDIIGKLHLLELPVYAVGIFLLSRAYGVEGVAIAWVLRVVLDTGALFLAARRFLTPDSRVLRHVGQLVLLALVLFGVGAVQGELVTKLVFLVIALVSFAIFAWVRVLGSAERAFLLRRVAAGT